MKYMFSKKLVRLICLIGPSIMAPWVCAEELFQPQSTTPYQQQAELLLQSLVDVTEVPAFSMAIVHRGELVAAVAVGHADREKLKPVTPAHLFRLASVSKVVGASMLAELVMDNQLDPDKALSHYYPELSKKYQAITVRQLLAHTSGMPHYQAIDGLIEKKHYTTAIAATATLKDRSLLSLPGTTYEYSTHGYTLAGAVFERITGQTLQQSLPLYMKSFTGRPTPLIENIHALHPLSANLYERSGNQVDNIKFDDKSYSVFGAGLSATATDLAYFGAKVLNKSRDSDNYQRLLFTPVTTRDGRLAGDAKEQIGFGWRIGKSEQGKTIYHHAGTTPGARSVLLLYPEQDLSVVFLSNSSWVSSIEKTANTLVELYLSDAKAELLPTKATYSLDYQGTAFSGNLHCSHTSCALMNDKSLLSKWLQKFNPTSQQAANWPIYAFRSATDKRLIMVTKVGFIDLTGTLDTSGYLGDSGTGSQISLTLHETPKPRASAVPTL